MFDLHIRYGFIFFNKYFNTLILGYFNIKILICGLVMRRSRSYLEYNIDQYTFACDLKSVSNVFVTFDCLNVFELEFMFFFILLFQRIANKWIRQEAHIS